MEAFQKQGRFRFSDRADWKAGKMGRKLQIWFAIALACFIFESQGNAGDILLISRYEEPSEGAFHPDDSLVEFLESLGHQVDTSLMGDQIRPIHFDEQLLTAVERADAIIVSSAVPTRDGGVGSSCGVRFPGPNPRLLPAFESGHFAFLDRPALVMDASASLYRNVARIGIDESSPESIRRSNHPFFEGIADGDLQVFDWDANGKSIDSLHRPTISLAKGNGATNAVIQAQWGEYTFMSEVADGSERYANRRVFLGHWDYDFSSVDFFDFVTDDYKQLLSNIVNDLVDDARRGDVSSRIEARYDFSGNGFYDAEDIEILTASIGGIGRQEHDIDQDGQVSNSDRIMLIEDVFWTYIGDSNLDGEFGTSDIIQVFQQGKWQTNELATWEEGDWNGDHRFDSGDFVAAFRTGGYCAGPRQFHAVPEPNSFSQFVIVLLVASGFVLRR